MKPKVLYIMSSYNIYGGTPKKTLDLMKFFKENSVLYVYNNTYQEFKYLFENTGGKVYEGFYEKNYFKHLNKLLKIVKDNNVDIVQTQFSMGETLGYLLKKFNPKIKLVAAFVGSNKPSTIKSVFLNQIYKKVDYFIYVSKYVKREKENQFPLLLKKESKVIYNGAELREDLGDGEVNLKRISILGIATLLLGISGMGCVRSIHIGPGLARRIDAAIHSISLLHSLLVFKRKKFYRKG